MGLLSLELQGMAGDGLNDIELIKEENSSLLQGSKFGQVQV